MKSLMPGLSLVALLFLHGPPSAFSQDKPPIPAGADKVTGTDAPGVGSTRKATPQECASCGISGNPAESNPAIGLVDGEITARKADLSGKPAVHVQVDFNKEAQAAGNKPPAKYYKAAHNENSGSDRIEISFPEAPKGCCYNIEFANSHDFNLHAILNANSQGSANGYVELETCDGPISASLRAGPEADDKTLKESDLPKPAEPKPNPACHQICVTGKAAAEVSSKAIVDLNDMAKGSAVQGLAESSVSVTVTNELSVGKLDLVCQVAEGSKPQTWTIDPKAVKIVEIKPVAAKPPDQPGGSGEEHKEKTAENPPEAGGHSRRSGGRHSNRRENEESPGATTTVAPDGFEPMPPKEEEKPQPPPDDREIGSLKEPLRRPESPQPGNQGENAAVAPQARKAEMVGLVMASDSWPGEPASVRLVMDPVDLENTPGLHVVAAMVFLPRDRHGKATLSGEVLVTPPNGRPQPADKPVDYTVPDAPAAPFTVALAGDPTPVGKFTVAHKERRPSHPRKQPARFSMLPVMPDSGVCLVHGPFHGNSSKTHIAVNGEPAELLAETPRETFFEPRTVRTGRNDVTVNEDGRVESFAMFAPNLAIHTDRAVVKQGETIAFEVTITGLKEMPASAWRAGRPSELYDLSASASGVNLPPAGGEGEILLVIKNKSPEIVTMSGAQGEVVVVALKRADLVAGTYEYDASLTARQAGAFNLEASLIPMLAETDAGEVVP